MGFHDFSKNLGEEYVSSRGKVVAAKQVKTKKDCLDMCKYSCAKKITESQRQLQFKGFYKLKNKIRQQDFILRTTERNIKKRSTTSSNESRRSFSFLFFLNIGERRIQVCKKYYLGTFDISQTRVYNAHKNKCLLTGMAAEDLRGKTASRKISPEKEKKVVDHINSFPRIESHYCRAKTKKQYLDPNLTIETMYDLYAEKTNDPLKSSYYRYIFCTKFNLDFHQPKSDRCGKCEKYKKAKEHSLLTEDMSNVNELHLKLKHDMRDEKSKDVKGTVATLKFDMENVQNCPRAKIGPMYCYSKLNVYNLTAHLSVPVLDKITKNFVFDEKTKSFLKLSYTYCALWTEFTSGRTGNDIASALVKILSQILEDHPQLEVLITWSDSCVPQNRNSIMSCAILKFLQNHPQLKSIVMKYSIDGHGAVQEVDNIHSAIEKVFAVNEYFTPKSLIELLKTVNRTNPYKIIEMVPEDFIDFGEYAKQHYNFTKLRVIKFTQSMSNVEYCLSYDESLSIIASVQLAGATDILHCNELKLVSKPPELSELKQRHLILMFDYMSPTDIEYYENVLNLDRTKFLKKKSETESKHSEPCASTQTQAPLKIDKTKKRSPVPTKKKVPAGNQTKAQAKIITSRKTLQCKRTAKQPSENVSITTNQTSIAEQKTLQGARADNIQSIQNGNHAKLNIATKRTSIAERKTLQGTRANKIQSFQNGNHAKSNIPTERTIANRKLQAKNPIQPSENGKSKRDIKTGHSLIMRRKTRGSLQKK